MTCDCEYFEIDVAFIECGGGPFDLDQIFGGIKFPPAVLVDEFTIIGGRCRGRGGGDGSRRSV